MGARLFINPRPGQSLRSPGPGFATSDYAARATGRVTRFELRCHKRCGARYPLKAATINREARAAVAAGRSEVLLGN